MPSVHLRLLSVACVAMLCACSREPAKSPAQDPAAIVNSVADQYYEFTLSRYPETAYFSGITPERHDGISDNSPEARLAEEAAVDEMLERLQSVSADSLAGAPEWITHGYLVQSLRDAVAKRVCRSELWDVNQMGGWHLGATQIAQLQPVGTPEFRQQSLTRWTAFVGYIDQEIENLKAGLDAGYSAPKTVVRRVIEQIDGLLALGTEESPFYSPALRDDD